MARPHPIRMSEAEYLAHDLAHDEKHEFVNGEVLAMAGADPAHDRAVVNLILALGSRLRGGPCVVHSADLRVHLDETGLYAYPDVTVLCGPPRFADTRPRSLRNPTFLVEVLSPTTAAWDTGAKGAHYRRQASLQGYLLVSLPDRRLELFERQQDGRWLLTTAVAQEVLTIEALGLELPLDEVFAGVAELLEAR